IRRRRGPTAQRLATLRADVSAASVAVVVQRAWRRRACYARGRAQIFVDGPQVTVRQILKSEPRHHLEKITVERRPNAAWVDGPSWTGRMQVIEIHAGSHDQEKLFKRVAPFRQPSIVRCQIAGDNVRRTITWRR